MKKRGQLLQNLAVSINQTKKFSGKGYAAHSCKPCAFSLPPEKKSENGAMNPA